MFDKFVLIQLGTNHIFKVHAGNKLKKKPKQIFWPNGFKKDYKISFLSIYTMSVK